MMNKLAAKKIVTIQARMGSDRLPGKILLPLSGKPSLERMVERVRRSKYIDDVVVATTTNPKDDVVEKWAVSAGISLYRGSESDVLSRVVEAGRKFRAEILVQLYALLGDARAIMSVLALATQILVVAAILSGVVIILQLYRTRFAVLRALGATPGYVFLVAWTYVTLLILAGAVLGLGLGAGASWAVSGYLEARSGIAIPVTIAWPEIQLVLLLIAAGAILAVLPAIAIYRQPVVDGLR